MDEIYSFRDAMRLRRHTCKSQTVTSRAHPRDQDDVTVSRLTRPLSLTADIRLCDLGERSKCQGHSRLFWSRVWFAEKSYEDFKMCVPNFFS